MKIAIASMAAALAVSASAGLPQPYGHWKMDDVAEGGKVIDASGNGLDMTLGEGVGLVDDVMFGKVLRWEGTRGSWAKFENPGITNRTISVWFKRDALDADLDTANNNKIPFLISNWSNLNVNYGKNTVAFNAYIAGLNYYNIAMPSRSRWHQLTITVGDTRWYDEAKTNHVGTFRIYIDGVQTKNYENIVMSKNLKYSCDCIIGNSTVNPASDDPRPFKGCFAQIRVWDEAFSPEDVRQLYLDDLQAANPVPLGRWKLDETVETGSGELHFVPEGESAVDLVNAGNAAVVDDDDFGGAVTEFPNYASNSYASFALPDSTANLSFGMWMKVPENLLEISRTGALDNAAKTNTIPHIYTFGMYSRTCLEGSHRNPETVAAHVFDIGTLDNGNDQGFFAPVIMAQKGRWCHFGMTFETTLVDGLYAVTPRIYVDGACVYTGDVQTAANYAGAFEKDKVFTLGTGSTSNPRSFCGRMADFAAYAALLSDDQMAELARGLPTVDAGADFTLAAGVSGRLQGTLSLTGRMGNRRAAAVKPYWTMVSCPEGGEAAEIAMADSLNPSVVLPVAGEYVFRLAARSVSIGISECDEVTVTCVAPAADNAAPAVTVAGDRTAAVRTPLALTATCSDADDAPSAVSVRWKCLSGPGAAGFEPACGAATKATFYAAGEYKIAAVAFDGQSETESAPFTVTVADAGSIDLDSGLIAYWPFDASLEESVTGTAYGIDRKTCTFEKGVDGYGIRCNTAFYPYLDTKMTLLETTSDQTYFVPDERYRAFSVWIYHDPADTNVSKCATIVSVAYSMGIWYNCEDGKNGFTLYQNATANSPCAGAGDQDVYGRPPVNPEGRWTHVYALFDRNTPRSESTSELWIDGVKMTNRTMNGMGGSRVRAGEYIMIGGHKATGAGNNGHFKDGDGNYISRTFPGIIDEVRMYNRKLTEAEIGYLAANPVVDVNRAPAVAVSSSKKRVGTRKAAAIAAATGDDRKAAAELTGGWRVVSGDASAVSFADASAAETEFTATETGVYLLSYVVSDGEKETWSEPLEVNVVRSGMAITIR